MIKIDIEGAYSKIGTQLIKENLTLLLVKRKDITPSKPSKFILAKLPNGTRRYISSMYPTIIQGAYNIDYLGQSYILSVGEDIANIQKGKGDE